jgi:hypothetical protein
LFINDLESSTQNPQQSVGFEIGNRNTDKFDFYVGTEVADNRMLYENNLSRNNRGYQYNINADLSFDITEIWSFESIYEYTIYKNNVLANQSFPMLKANLSRFMMKNDRRELKLSVFDALNKNREINYRNNLNHTQTSQTNVLNRSVMFSFMYFLSKLGKSNMDIKGHMR